jgi:hypothetical protein
VLAHRHRAPAAIFQTGLTGLTRYGWEIGDGRWELGKEKAEILFILFILPKCARHPASGVSTHLAVKLTLVFGCEKGNLRKQTMKEEARRSFRTRRNDSQSD